MGPYLEALDEVRVALRSPQTRRVTTRRRARVRRRFRRLPAAPLRTPDASTTANRSTGPSRRSSPTRPSGRGGRRDAATSSSTNSQDLTPAYLLLLRLVASPRLQVFGVGDDDQVIYGYGRGRPRVFSSTSPTCSQGPPPTPSSPTTAARPPWSKEPCTSSATTSVASPRPSSLPIARTRMPPTSRSERLDGDRPRRRGREPGSPLDRRRERHRRHRRARPSQRGPHPRESRARRRRHPDRRSTRPRLPATDHAAVALLVDASGRRAETDQPAATPSPSSDDPAAASPESGSHSSSADTSTPPPSTTSASSSTANRPQRWSDWLGDVHSAIAAAKTRGRPRAAADHRRRHRPRLGGTNPRLGPLQRRQVRSPRRPRRGAPRRRPPPGPGDIPPLARRRRVATLHLGRRHPLQCSPRERDGMAARRRVRDRRRHSAPRPGRRHRGGAAHPPRRHHTLQHADRRRRRPRTDPPASSESSTGRHHDTRRSNHAEASVTAPRQPSVAVGDQLRISGGYEGTAVAVDRSSVTVALATGAELAVPLADVVAVLVPAVPTDNIVDALKAWRLDTSARLGVPAYVVMHDSDADRDRPSTTPGRRRPPSRPPVSAPANSTTTATTSCRSSKPPRPTIDVSWRT